MIRLAIFEDNDSLRVSLVNYFNAQENFFVTGSFFNAQNIRQIILESRPNVVILDIEMPMKNGISAIPVIKDIDPEIIVVMYTQFEDDDKIFDSIRAGADGYILKQSSPSKLLTSLEEIMEGGAYMTPGVARKVFTYFHVKEKLRKPEFNLTKREKEVLQFLIKGYIVKNIAEELFISFDTVKSHLRNIYKKLHVKGGKGAIAKVLSEKISLD